MPIPAQRDLETTRTALRDWIAPKLAERSDAAVTDVEISQLDAPGGSGFSNETFLADVTWNAGGTPMSDSVVVRIEPSGYRVFMEADFALQYRMLDTLDKQTDVTVPHMLLSLIHI